MTGAGHASAGRLGIGLWKGLSHASRRLIIVGVALLLAMVLAVGIALWNMRVVALEDARANDAKLGTAIAEQTAQSIQAIDVILQQLRTQVTEQAPPFPGGAHNRVSNPRNPSGTLPAAAFAPAG